MLKTAKQATSYISVNVYEKPDLHTITCTFTITKIKLKCRTKTFFTLKYTQTIMCNTIKIDLCHDIHYLRLQPTSKSIYNVEKFMAFHLPNTFASPTVS